MDNVDLVIYYMEHGESKEPITDDDPRRIYEAIDNLYESNKYNYLQFWQNVKEYQRAKLVRSMALPNSGNKEDNEISINIVNGKEKK